VTIIFHDLQEARCEGSKSEHVNQVAMRKVQQGQILPDNPQSDALLENMVATEMRTLWEPILRELVVVLSSLSPPLVSARKYSSVALIVPVYIEPVRI